MEWWARITVPAVDSPLETGYKGRFQGGKVSEETSPAFYLVKRCRGKRQFFFGKWQFMPFRRNCNLIEALDDVAASMICSCHEKSRYSCHNTIYSLVQICLYATYTLQEFSLFSCLVVGSSV